MNYYAIAHDLLNDYSFEDLCDITAQDPVELLAFLIEEGMIDLQLIEELEDDET